jgi:antitoxin CptB
VRAQRDAGGAVPALASSGQALYIPGHMSIDHDSRLRRLKFRAWHRGFREADLILGPFADQHVSTFSDAELDWFEELLEQPDQDLYGWILERSPTPAEFDGPLMDRLKAFRDEAHKNITPRGTANG